MYICIYMCVCVDERSVDPYSRVRAENHHPVSFLWLITAVFASLCPYILAELARYAKHGSGIQYVHAQMSWYMLVNPNASHGFLMMLIHPRAVDPCSYHTFWVANDITIRGVPPILSTRDQGSLVWDSVCIYMKLFVF